MPLKRKNTVSEVFMDKKTVFITGASGSMGSEVLKQIMATKKFRCRILLRDKPTNRKLAAKLLKNADEGALEVVFGDLGNYDDCVKCVSDADYVLHMAAIIPPASDHNPKAAEKANFFGTKNLVDAIKASPRADEIKFVETGTVAEYGNRDYKHPWGRVGDPLVPSCYDFYAITKLRGERYVVESGLKNWVSLRQSGILYDNIMNNNMSDGLMFHTCYNTPIEWATARDSGVMLRNLVVFDSEGTLDKSFWRKCYNIGNGAGTRVTGYDTLDEGFKMMGCEAKDIFRPHWNAMRNFHCMWYYDSDKLEEYLHFRSETAEQFWKNLGKKCWYFKFGKPFKGLIRKLAIERLFKSSNAPMYWINHNMEGRVNAFFGSYDEWKAIPRDWDKFPLLCKGQIPDGKGGIKKIDYEDLKDITKVKEKGLLLSHGYDEDKPDEELGYEDFQQAAEFRGGKCLTKDAVKGDLYTKIEWECHDGHKFMASPYAVLKAGFWCPECCQPTPWNFDALSKKVPFFAQIWYDTHSPEENNFYDADCYKDILEADAKN